MMRGADLPVPSLAMLTQTPPDVLDVDDRVVDDDADGDHEPRQDHRVDRVSAQVEHHHRRHQGQRDRDQADQRGAPLEEEGDQHQDHEQRAEDQRQLEVVDRLLDEVRLPEDVASNSHAGKAGLQVVERIFDVLGDLQRVCVRELLQDEQQAGAAVDDGVADQRLGPVHHVRDVAQAHRLAVAALDRQLGQVVEAPRTAGRAGCRASGSGCRPSRRCRSRCRSPRSAAVPRPGSPRWRS